MNGNRLTGEARDLITSKLTLVDPPQAFPGSGGLLAHGGTITYPFSSEFAEEIKRHLAAGMIVVRAWDVLWPADGSEPRVICDTGYLQ
jgi:hypothetical protein